MHFPRKYETCKSKTETLRDENVFLELKVRTESFYLFQVCKLFTVIYQTCVVPKYSVYVIVSDCLLSITLFDDLDLYFKLKHQYPSWSTSAYFPRGTPANRYHHCKCCIMIIIILRMFLCVCMCVRMCIRTYICTYVRTCMRACVRSAHAYAYAFESARV